MTGLSAILRRIAGVAFAAMFAVAASPAFAEGGTLVWGTTQNPRHLNPAVQSGIATMMPGTQIFASPLRYDDKWNPQAYLAETWSLQDDGKSLLLRLVPNAKFHDGTPITSEDVAFSIMTNKANHPFKSMFEAVERVDTPDARTAIVRMSKANPAILLAMSPPLCPIIPKHIYGKVDNIKATPLNSSGVVGSGAFKLVEFKSGDHITLERNPDFFIKGMPKFDRIVIRIFKDSNALAIALENGEVNYVPFWSDLSVLQRLKKNPKLAVTDKGGEAIGPLNWLAFNMAKKPLDDVRVRQAISYAIDRNFITKKLHYGFSKIATGPITLGSPFYTSDVEHYNLNLAKANQLLDAAGHKKGANGVRFHLTVDFIPGNREMHQTIAEYLKAQLRKVGIDVEVRAAPDFPTWAKRVSGHDFDMTTDSVFNWGDPVIGVHRTYLTSNIRKGVIWSNTQSYSNPKVDELLTQAGVETNVEKRKALYRDAQKIVVKEAPVAYINVIPYYQVYDKNLHNLPTTIWGATAPVFEMNRK